MGIREWVADRLVGGALTRARVEAEAAIDYAVKTEQQAASAKSFAGGLSWSQLWLSGNDSQYRPLVYTDTPDGWLWAAEFNPWASSAIEARARWVSSIPFRLVKPKPDSSDTDDDDDFEEVKEAHPVMDLLEQVNEQDDRVSYIYNGVVQLSIGGEWFTRVVLSGGKPSELYMLPFHDVQVMRFTDEDVQRGGIPGYPSRYRYRGMVDYSPDEILRVFYASPRDPFMAISPTSKAIEAINRYRLADLAQEAIDKNGGQGGGIVGADFDMIQGDPARFMSEWNAKRKDPARMAEDKFLPPGMTYETGQITAQQAQREERSDRLKKETFAAYGTPPAVAGDMSDASILANADMQERMFAKGYVKPEAEMIARRFTDQLLYRYWPELKAKGWKIRPNFEGVTALQDDEAKLWEIKNAKATYAVTINGGGLSSLNEARRVIDLEDVDDERAEDVLQISDAPEAAPVDVEDSEPDMTPEEEAAMIEAESQVTDAEDTALDTEVLALTTEAVATAPAAPAQDAAPAQGAQTKPPTEPLNGAQVQALVEIIQAVSDESLPPIAARELILNAFPQLDVASVDRMIDDALSNKAPAAKSDVPGQMGPRGGDARGNFDENKHKRVGGKFAPKAGGGAEGAATGEKPKRERKKDPKKEAERKAKQAAKRVEKAKERIAKLDADEAKLKDALAAMQGKDDPSNLRKRISKALERVAKRREKMQGIIDRKGEKDDAPAASEADKLSAEVAGKAEDSFTPPDAVQRAAERGLKLRGEFNRGGTEIGVARARDLSNGRGISMDTIGRMVSYFARHEVDKQGEGWADESAPSAGYIAWLLWGGDPGRAWAERIYEANKPAAKATLMPVVDFVGMTATDTDGLVLGTVDSIKRQGSYEGITATPSAPVVVVAGKAYRADEVRVMMGGE